MIERIERLIEMNERMDNTYMASELREIKVGVKLLEAESLELQCLNNAGVDNWSGYDYAMKELDNYEN